MKFEGDTEIGPLMPKIAIWNWSPGLTGAPNQLCENMLAHINPRQ